MHRRPMHGSVTAHRANVNLRSRQPAPLENRMSIDERLEKLTERHEALTQSVESLTMDVRDLAKDVNDLAKHVRDLTEDVKELSATVAKQGSLMNDLMAGFSTMVEIVRSHETRIERLEGR